MGEGEERGAIRIALNQREWNARAMSLAFAILGGFSSIGLLLLPNRHEIWDVSVWTGISAIGDAAAFAVIRAGRVSAGVLSMTFISLTQHVLISFNPQAALAIPYFASIFVLIAATSLERKWLWPVFASAALCLLAEWYIAVDLGVSPAQLQGTHIPAAVLLAIAALVSWLHGTGMDKAIELGRRYESERAALHAKVAADRRMEDLGRLAGAIAHDFNNLLFVMQGSADLARNYLGKDHPAREELNQIEAAGVRAESLTLQLLAYSRRQIVEKTAFDVGTVLRELLPIVERLVGPTIRLDAPLPAGEFIVIGSATQLERVILNLAGNARDASAGNGAISIELASSTLGPDEILGLGAGNYVQVSVHDAGVGMATETLQRIFEPFFTTKGKASGTGLGLTTSLGLVKEMGGTILASSEPNVGSTFRVVLPRASSRRAGTVALS